MDLDALRKLVEKEIDAYVYEVPEGALGSPMPDEWITTQLREMREALVPPVWKTIDIADSTEQIKGIAPAERRDCVLVADDKGDYQLYYDPKEGDFVLAYAAGGLPTSFLRGDAVGCFIAR